MPKFPVFCPGNIELWFAQAENQFTIAGITQDATKYAHFAVHFDGRWAEEVNDIILNPPTTG